MKLTDSRHDENQVSLHSWLALGTVVNIQVVANACSEETVRQATQQAMEAIKTVERACSRFDADSELVQLVHAPAGRAVTVSPILFQSLQFACEVAKFTDGKFDPTVGSRMQELGFQRHYLTGESVHWSTDAHEHGTYQDIELDAENQTVCLHRPLLLDLGAVAKGLAVDLAVKTLAAYDFEGYVVDAGGDLYAAGTNREGDSWTIDIRHPVYREKSIWTFKGQNVAVCTSGTYERQSPKDAASHHILDAHKRSSAQGYLSLTAVGPFTMMTDAFSTAAFLYPPAEALQILQEIELEGLLVTEDLEIRATPGMEGTIHESV